LHSTQVNPLSCLERRGEGGLGDILPIPPKSILPPVKFSYLFTVSSFMEQTQPALNLVTVPDLWQQQAVAPCAKAGTWWCRHPPARARR